MYRFISLFIALSIVIMLSVQNFAYKQVITDLTEQARHDIELKTMLMQAVLDKERIAVQILAQNPDIIEALSTQNQHKLTQINLKLEDIAHKTNTTVIYLLNNDGEVLSSSNWNKPSSFIGNNFQFRKYFIEAEKNQLAEHFAQGKISNELGFYIAHKIQNNADQSLGVIVLKITFTKLEHSWNNSNQISFVTNKDGIIVITNRNELRFHTINDINSEQKPQISNSLQFGINNFTYLPLTKNNYQLVTFNQRKFVYLNLPITSTNWQFHLLLDATDNLQVATKLSLSLSFLVLVILGFIIWYFWTKHLKNTKLKLKQIQIKQELEHKVNLRTIELNQANLALKEQINERIKTENKLKTLSQQLASANRLAILGQSIAGVIHEVNQPLTAIRSYAENAQTILMRKYQGINADNNLAYANLKYIVNLTERIHAITNNLRNFARKDHHKTAQVSIKEAIEGAQMVLSSRIDQANCQIETVLPPDNWCVLAGQISLEQVLINLIQNAIEASFAREFPQIKIFVTEQEKSYTISVQDNGCGISSDILHDLFTPFTTNKAHGLGLGLVISKEIIHSFNGKLTFTSNNNGTIFNVILNKI